MEVVEDDAEDSDSSIIATAANDEAVAVAFTDDYAQELEVAEVLKE